MNIGNVFSLFDGMSCGQIALNRANIKYDNYYACEIDKYAIQVTQHNYPNTIQLGDVTKISGYNLPKIDLLIGGSPCQGFSLAGKMLNFDDPRSKLFFEYVRILKELRENNPNIKFLLENVKMKKWCQDVISKYLGVEPINLNSSLVSAQKRDRLYWTNIDFNTNIKDKGLVLKDILEKDVDEKYFISDKLLKTFSRPSGKNKSFFEKETFVENKSNTLTSRYYKMGRTDTYISDRNPLQINDSKESGGKQPYQQNRIYDTDRLCPALLAQLDKQHTILEKRTKYVQLDPKGKGNNSQTDRVRFGTSLSASFTASNCSEKNKVYFENKIRKLTPTECERLQTVPDGYTSIVSDTQAYKMLGNGWTVDIIVEVFKGLGKEENVNRKTCLSLFDAPTPLSKTPTPQ